MIGVAATVADDVSVLNSVQLRWHLIYIYIS